MKDTCSIAVLMTCYNRFETTLRCLERLRIASARMKDARFDVWLVDDASPDGTGEKVRSAFPEVNIIQSQGNLFWCKGMRLAWDTAVASGVEYDFYLWLNDDAMLKEDALQTIFGEYSSGRGLVVGRFSTDEREADTSFGLIGPKGDWMHGNLVLVPKAVYDRIGPICGDYHHGYGDHDYGLHAKSAGFDLRLTSAFCGVCPQQPERYHWLDGQPFCKRIRLMFDPKGYNLHDAMLFRYRNWGVMMALVCLAHMSLRVVFPKLVK